MRRSLGPLVALLVLLAFPVVVVGQVDCPGGVCPLPQDGSPVDLFPLDQLPDELAGEGSIDGQPECPGGVCPAPNQPTPACPGGSCYGRGWSFMPPRLALPERSVVVTRYWFMPAAMPAQRGYSVFRPLPRRTAFVPRWFAR